MGYLLAFLSLIANTVKGFCGKKTSIYAVAPTDAPLFSFVRIFFCIIIGFFIVLIEGAQGSLSVDPVMLAICALSGVTNAVFLICWMLAVQKNPLVLVDVSLTLGSIIPAVLCLAFFGEDISPLKMLGFALIVAAAFVLSFGAKNTKKTSLSGILLVTAAAIGLELTSFSQKLFDNHSTASGAAYPKSVFLFYGYIFAAVALLIYFVFVVLMQKAKKKENAPKAKELFRPLLRPLPHILIMSACLFADNYFKTAGIAYLPSQVLYPIIQGGCLITVNISAAMFFGEKTTLKTVLGSAIALGGIIIMSIA